MVEGRGRAGANLRATRQSAAFFGVSRNTAAEVYERLVTEGYAVARQGAGTYVSERIPWSRSEARRIAEEPEGHQLNEFWRRPDVTAAMSFCRDSPDSTSPTRRGSPVDFRPAMVDSRLFPLDVFRRVTATQLRGLARTPANYKMPQGNQGNYHLSKPINTHTRMTRAVAC